MSAVLTALQTLHQMTAQQPADDADPDAVLQAADALMAARAPIFEELQSLLKAQPDLTAEMSTQAQSLAALDAQWSLRMADAKRALLARLQAHRRMRGAERAAQGAPVSQIQV